MSTRDILVLAETQRDALADISLELVAAARQLASATGGKVLVLLPGRAGDSHVAALAGADRILRVDDPRLASYSPEPYLAVLEDVVAAERPRAVLIGATSIGWDLAPMLSARLGAPLVTGCKQIQADGEALRVTASFCGGKMLADVQIGGAPAILMVLPGSYRPTGQAGEGQVEPRAMPALAGPGAVCFEELIQPESGDVDITQQEILVAVGRGIQQKENLELAEELAEAMGGAVCASRPVIDQGWMPATRQVGKSGMTVKPKCFLALGISGAPEHIEGMKDSELIVAVNTDPNAPIFDVAHYGVVADMLELVPALTEAMKAK